VADRARLRDRLRFFLLLLLALLVVDQLTLPFRMAGIGFAVAALWVAIRLLAQLIGGRAGPDPGARSWLAVISGLVLAGVMLVALLAEAVYYPVISDLERCTAGANTETAKQACKDASNDRVNKLLDEWKRRAETP
jgi:hypothetical protein